MHISILLMEQIIELFIMILMGFIIVKAGIVTEKLDSIVNDVHIIMVIFLFSFCWSCMKSWRTHSLKGVRK